jgi:hypothetical protein
MAINTLAKQDLKPVNDGKVTSTSSSHPVGTTLGTLGGAAAGVGGAVAAGAAMGAAVGPAGAALGAAVGGVVGAMTGHTIAAQINPKDEDLFWRANYSGRPYVKDGSNYTVYQPAYMYGVESYSKNPDRNFDEIEPTLSEDWYKTRGNSTLDWEEAKLASRDAYERLHSRK